MGARLLILPLFLLVGFTDILYIYKGIHDFCLPKGIILFSAKLNRHIHHASDALALWSPRLRGLVLLDG